jgi:uncharacterized protein
MYKRQVNLSKSHSFFLFGPRSTGKTTLLRESYEKQKNIWINLLDTKIESKLRQNPEHLEDLININKKFEFVIIDEVQKNPALLDVVHR